MPLKIWKFASVAHPVVNKLKKIAQQSFASTWPSRKPSSDLDRFTR
jgi:hypothetical protein